MINNFQQKLRLGSGKWSSVAETNKEINKQQQNLQNLWQ